MSVNIILDEIIAKGGIYGRCASMYYNNKIAAKLFVHELAEQCDSEYTQQIWGQQLIEDIKLYTKQKQYQYEK